VIEHFLVFWAHLIYLLRGPALLDQRCAADNRRSSMILAQSPTPISVRQRHPGNGGSF